MDTPPVQPSAQKPQKSDENATFLGLKFAGELGYIIAVPAILFGFGGAYLDHNLHTTPLFILIGLALAFVISFIGVKRKVKEIVEATDNPKDTRPQKP